MEERKPLHAAKRGEATGNLPHLLAKASVVSVGILTTRLLGLGREIALAAMFGRQDTDAFYVAFTIPNVLRQLLSEGAMSTAVVPVLAGCLIREGDVGMRVLCGQLKGAFLVMLAGGTAMGILCSRWLCELFASGAHAYPAQFERIVSLTRLLFPYLFLIGVSTLEAAFLQVKGHFFVSSFAPALLNVSFLLCMLVFPSWFASQGLEPAYTLCLGALIGGVLQVVVQWPALSRIGYWVKPVVNWRAPAVRDCLGRISPQLFGVGVYCLDVVISRRLLSQMGVGAQSYFSWAMRICDLPQGIFAIALSTVLLPSFASIAPMEDRAALKRMFSYTLRMVLLFAIPSSVGLMVLSEPVVAALFGRGRFDAVAVEQTGRALVWQAAGLWMVSVVRQVIALLHAVRDLRTPVLVSAADLLVFVLLAQILTKSMGHVGVSAAMVAASGLQMVLLLASAYRRVGGLSLGEVGLCACRLLAASVPAAASGWAVAHALQGTGSSFYPGAGGLLMFTFMFLAVLWGCDCRELREVLQGVAHRLSSSQRR